RRACAGARLASCARQHARREATDPPTGMARADPGRRTSRPNDDGSARRFEREGEERARLAPAPSFVASGICRDHSEQGWLAASRKGALSSHATDYATSGATIAFKRVAA